MPDPDDRKRVCSAVLKTTPADIPPMGRMAGRPKAAVTAPPTPVTDELQEVRRLIDPEARQWTLVFIPS
jgi:hypothetical protein